jgi:hypothetical protein
MGGSGILLSNKHPEGIAKLCHTIMTRKEIREDIIDKQLKRAESFSVKKIKEKLNYLINEWNK